MALQYQHLVALTDNRGIFEHALYDTPRLEHGYCVDDVARALIVLERNQPRESEVFSLRNVYLDFLRAAQTPDGLFINRCDVNGNWNGPAEATDHWGRGLWALGTVHSYDSDWLISAEMLWRFEHGARHRSPFLRSMMFAGLGAAAVLRTTPMRQQARDLLRDAAEMVLGLMQARPDHPDWLWPEQSLTYANAIIPEVLLLAGDLLEDSDYVELGLALLDWLLEQETSASQFSVTPTTGHTFNQQRGIFDQQSIEVAALVDACSTAFEITGDSTWLAYVARGARWFEGFNDANVQMYNPETGAGFDGLTPDGRNENCGAESTICYLSVMDQHQRYFGVLQ